MTNFYRRVEMRYAIEDPRFPHDDFIGTDFAVAPEDVPEYMYERLAQLETEDIANPIAATAVVRRDARDTAGPDLDAFAAAFATALTQHDEEYL